MTPNPQVRRTSARPLVAALGLALALGAAILAGAPTAGATPDQPAVRSVKVYYAPDKPQPPVAKALDALPRTDVVLRPAVTTAPASQGQCQGTMHVCLWTGDYFSGTFVGFSGSYDMCEGWRLEGSAFQDHVWSIWNRWSEPITLWDRFADGTYRYNKYAWLPGGYSHDTRFTHIMDAWVWDHYNNCTSLNLHHYQ